tara:strand:- start:1116 stop:1832 length:717 start_codon:yes stop_codon:yes gene_type:complete
MAFSKNIRLFTEQDILQNVNINLVDRNINYLKNVMRCKDGDYIRLFNGRDGEWLCELMDIQSRPFVVPRKIFLSQNSQKKDSIWVIFSLIKSSRSKILIEKATELGASKIIAIKAARSNVKSINLSKATLTSIESAEQCGRITVPQLKYYNSFGSLFQKWPSGRSFIWGDKNSNYTDSKIFINIGGLIIGPEGGFVEEEIKLFQSFSKSQSFSLGELTLRSETAAVVMISIWKLINKL